MGGGGPATAAAYTGSHVDANVNAMFVGARWTSTAIRYSFPDANTEFEFGGASYASGEMSSFATLDSSQRTQISSLQLPRYWNITGLSYVAMDETASVHADIRYSRTNLYATAAAYYPGNSIESGDVWLGNTRFSGSGFLWQDGTYESTAILHETGHAHGLKHSHETPAMPNATYDCRSYTIMSYHSYPGSGIGALTIATGHHPQGLMAFDLEALHTMYGKAASTGPVRYSFNASTGQTNRNGTPWFIPSVPCIHLCIWEPYNSGNIFDVQTSNEVVSINLNRLQWSTFFGAMVASLGGGFNAPGNVCMPYSDDPFIAIWAGSGGGTFTFNTSLTGNQIILPGNRSTYTWTGSGRNWTGTHTPTSKVYACTTMDYVSFADQENVPVSELAALSTSRTVHWVPA